MPHADASTYVPDLSKAEAYTQAILATKSLLEEQRNWVCALANASSLLWHAYKALPPPSCHVNWAGFYVLDPKSVAKSASETSTSNLATRNTVQSTKSSNLRLILGPFQGKVACQTIRWGRGVCGTAAADGRTVVVEDVEAWPGHIACDAESKSEIVVPIRDGSGRVVGVVDVDCGVVNGFDQEDVNGLEELVALLGAGCDW